MVWGAIASSVASTVIGSALNRNSRKKSEDISRMILPETINTGVSSYNTKTGEFNFGEDIRAGQNQSITDLKNRRTQVSTDYATTMRELGGLRGQVAGLRSFYQGNQSAYAEAMMNPLRQQTAAAKGELERNLGRTKVRGSFANQARANLAIDSGRAMSDQAAMIENQRINTLGDFIGMDADIIKEGIRSREGRTRLMAELDTIIGGRYDTMMANEMDILKLPSVFSDAGAAAAEIQSNAVGVETEALIKGAGDILSAIDTSGSSSSGNVQAGNSLDYSGSNPLEYAP